MAPFEIARWMAARWIRQPIAWAWLVALSAVWPTVAALTPVGLSTSGGTEAEVLYELVLLGALLAAGTTLAVLERGGLLLAPLPPGRRLLVELSAHGTAAALFLVPALALAAGTGAPATTFAPHRLPLGALATVLHLGVLASVLVRLRLAVPASVAALPLVAWILPALLPPEGGLVPDLIRSALDVGRHLDLPEERAPHRIGSWLPIIGWGLTALSLSTPTHHALRHPR